MASYTVRCRSCGTANRVSEEHEGKKGRCGSCGTDLPEMYCHPVPLTDSTFDPFVARYRGPILAEFWAPW